MKFGTSANFDAAHQLHHELPRYLDAMMLVSDFKLMTNKTMS